MFIEKILKLKKNSFLCVVEVSYADLIETQEAFKRIRDGVSDWPRKKIG